jgi:hypothetical protein
MKLLESPQALLPHAAGWGEAVTARLRRDRVIMNGPRLVLVVSEVCAGGCGAGAVRSRSTRSEERRVGCSHSCATVGLDPQVQYMSDNVLRFPPS